MSQAEPQLVVPPIEEIISAPIPAAEWLIPRFVSAGDVTILGGPPRSGKSWIVADLALSWAGGQSALGFAPAFAQQRVLWIDEENSRPEAWTRVRNIIQGRSLSADRLRNWLVYPYPRQNFTFSKPGWAKELTRLVNDTDPHWIIFDSLIGVLRGHDENSSTQLRDFYSEHVKPLNADGKRGIIFLHHTRKRSLDPERGGSDYSDAEMLRGTGDIIAQVDSIIMCWREGGNAILHSDKARRDATHGSDPPWDLVIELTGTEGARKPRVCEQRPPHGIRAEESAEIKLVEILRTTGPLTVKGIQEKASKELGLKFAIPTIYSALQVLEARREVERVQLKGAAKGYRIMDHNPAPSTSSELPAAPDDGDTNRSN